MSKHTPGPWEAIENSQYWDINIAGDYLTLADACSSKFLPGGDNGEANARLMAAAPELLEALKFAYRFTGLATADEREWMRAAIAKAEGAS